MDEGGEGDDEAKVSGHFERGNGGCWVGWRTGELGLVFMWTANGERGPASCSTARVGKEKVMLRCQPARRFDAVSGLDEVIMDPCGIISHFQMRAPCSLNQSYPLCPERGDKEPQREIWPAVLF